LTDEAPHRLGNGASPLIFGNGTEIGRSRLRLGDLKPVVEGPR
jgi:hypothetical protein